jgi:ankyrin repeat protein
MITRAIGVCAAAVLLVGCTSPGTGSGGEASGTDEPVSATAATPTASGSPSGVGLGSASLPPEPATPTASPTATPSADPSLDLPLIGAAAAGDRGRVSRLLARGASVRATDERGRTPLVAAAYGNHVDVAGVLLAAGADPNEKDRTVQSAYLISTSEVGDSPGLLDLLLATGADVQSRDSFNGTGLIRAADRGFPRIVERLLRTDIPIDHVNRLGWTALHEAIILGDGSQDYVRVVELLVEAGADMTLPSQRDGVTPLAHARRLGHQGIVDVLVDAGARA